MLPPDHLHVGIAGALLLQDISVGVCRPTFRLIWGSSSAHHPSVARSSTTGSGAPRARRVLVFQLPFGDDNRDYYGRLEEIYELEFQGFPSLEPVIFKCYWFDPRVVRKPKNVGLVEIQQSSVYSGQDIYIVAQQATQV